MGEGEGGGLMGARGELPPIGGSKGPQPLASPNVLHWVGWLLLLLLLLRQSGCRDAARRDPLPRRAPPAPAPPCRTD